MGSDDMLGPEERLQYRELNGSPRNSAISGNAWEISRRRPDAGEPTISFSDWT